jgi:hypothetical protein
MKICKGGHRILGVSQIPHIERWALVVVVGNQKLSGDFRIPNDIGFTKNRLRSLLLAFWPLSVAEVVRVIVLLRLVNSLGRLCKVEDGFAHLEVPYHDFTIFTCTGQDVRDHSVPTDRSDP